MTTVKNLPATHIGDDRTITLTFKDGAGALEDLTGQTVKFRAYDDAGIEIAKSTGFGITHLAQSGDTLGQAQVTFVPADTRQWSKSTLLQYAVEKTDAAGKAETPVHGTWQLWPEPIV